MKRADRVVAIRRQSTPHPQLQRLLQEQRRMLREIARRRAAREAVEALAADLMPELFTRFAPLRQALTATSSELRLLFSALVSPTSVLGRRHRDRLRETYSLLMMEYDLPPLGSDVNSRPLDTPNHGGEASRPRRRSERTAGATKSGASARTVDGEQRDFASAQAPASTDSHRALRDCFRRLAVALHPDKVQDEAAREVRTELMKTVTQAYERGDIARLFELERSWLADVPAPAAEETLETRVLKQRQVNKELRVQLRAATELLKSTRASLPFGVELGSQDGGRKAAREQIDALLHEAKQEVEALVQITALTRDYVQGHVDLTSFLATLPQIGERDRWP